MMVLQNRDNGGLCPFTWQQFRVFLRVDLAGSCRLCGAGEGHLDGINMIIRL